MDQTSDFSLISSETKRRRTFAIISHPDAGKTTLTEKLLLYSGMIRTAGMVRGRKTGKKASSDWMAMEQERGISITASAMQFEYKGYVINVLDTPGHQDFSEDTYRTLTAADSAIMVIDAAKGVEAQTRKLFEVCAMHGIPVLTFINKMDLPARDPFELISELEDVLGIEASPRNWPIGSGRQFAGTADLETRNVTLFERSELGGAKQAKIRRMNIEDAYREGFISTEARSQLEYELELIDSAGNEFTEERFLNGKITQVFFGSALTNFGLEPFFDAFTEIAPSPRPRVVFSVDGKQSFLDPAREPFSGFVFKIQANMDKRHRDSMAFIRVCSGRFERDIVVVLERTGAKIRLSRSHTMMAGERDIAELAYPGDIVGVINPGVYAIGDTLSEKGGFTFKPLPQFSPEVVARIRPRQVTKRKSFDKGLVQLGNEGAIQVLYTTHGGTEETLVAAVGKLQFEVLQDRLQRDYNVETILEPLSYEHGAWIEGDPKTFTKPSRALLARDKDGQLVALFQTEREKLYAAEQNPKHKFLSFRY
ncbi:MAG TPA: peptide chain release factor 3 [Oligoflexia bacterium]|nr:peptide chain release factor 3 [Oligoflexia bacterium]HMP47060.1 peptide chain release factor 3 [Oligoflexia bacterium]